MPRRSRRSVATPGPPARLEAPDYTPGMKRAFGFAALLSFLTLQGCIASTTVLYVSADGHGRAVITSRVYEPALRAFDAMFAEAPRHAAIEEQLPAPGMGQLSAQFGAFVTLASTKLHKVNDGVVRTTIVEFPDVTKLRIPFPPVFALPAGGHFDLAGFRAQPRISFAFTDHENGNRLLMVRLPDERVDPGPEPEMTVFATDSREERLFKRAIEKMSLGLFIELENTALLRSNAPASKGNRVTILNLDLERVINNLDEAKVRRAMTPGSLQEVLWQLGDMPGAMVPREHEVFLEFLSPQATSQPPAAPQAPPDTEIYLAPLKSANGALELGTPVNITNSPGYDNQPSFTPDGSGVLFTSVRGASAGNTQSDIYKYDIATRTTSRLTQTPESEYSPTTMPEGRGISVIRVEADGTQRLWRVHPSGPKIEAAVILPDIKPVGYHAWADAGTVALFVLGPPATLQLADTRTGKARVVASDIGRAVQTIPGTGPVREISFVQRERTGQRVRLTIKKLNPVSGEVSVLTPAVEGSREADTAWTPDGTLFMASDGMLFSWKPGQTEWRPVTSLAKLSLNDVTRLAVSPAGDYLAIVASPRGSR